MSAHNILQQLKLANPEIQDPGTTKEIPVDRDFLVVPIVTGASGETNTLGAPTKANQFILLSLVTDGGGDRVITITGGVNQAETATTITFGDAGDWIMLMSLPSLIASNVETYRWRVVAGEGTDRAGYAAASAALTTPNLTTPVIIDGLSASGSSPNDYSASTGTFKTSSGANTLSGHTTLAAGKAFAENRNAALAAGTTGAKTAIITQVAILTCSDASHVFVTLPDPAVFAHCTVVNKSVQTADVYPYAAETINGTSHLTIATYKSARFYSDGTNWVALAGA